jgi:hypothetical protein
MADDAAFIDFKEHDGSGCPYRPDELVDVAFADRRIEFGAKASYWREAMWSWSGGNPRAHIHYHRPASNRFHLGGLPRSEEAANG